MLVIRHQLLGNGDISAARVAKGIYCPGLLCLASTSVGTAIPFADKDIGPLDLIRSALIIVIESLGRYPRPDTTGRHFDFEGGGLQSRTVQ